MIFTQVALLVFVVSFIFQSAMSSFINTPGQKYKITLKNEKKRYCLQFFNYENQIYER